MAKLVDVYQPAWAGNSVVRVPSSHGGSREFESLPAHHPTETKEPPCCRAALLKGATAGIRSLLSNLKWDSEIGYFKNTAAPCY